MSIENIVQVSITTQTTTPSRAGFGTPLVMGYHANFGESFRIYSSLADMVTDGFATTDAIYLAVAAIFAQNPRVSQVVVGRQTTAPTHVETLDFSAFAIADNTAYTVELNGQEATYTTGTGETAAQVSAGLKLALDALSEPVTVVDDLAGELTLTADVAGDIFRLYAPRSQSKRNNTTADTGLAADLTALVTLNNDWFSLHLASQSTAEIQAVAARAESNKKLFVYSTADWDVLDAAETTDVASVLQTAAYDWSVGLWGARPHQHGGAAFAGKMLPTDPGSATWKFKTLAGVSADDLTTTEKTNAKNKNANVYTTVAGVNMTEEGVAASGEFVDIVRGTAWLQARICEAVFAVLVNAQKIPFTDAGIAIVENALRGQLQNAVAVGLLAATPEFTVSVPLAADVSWADKGNRCLPDILFTATFAGAIHKVAPIQGTISV
jgi:hypothetical protein